MQKFNGRLLYLGEKHESWGLTTESGEVNLKMIVEDFFASLHGKHAIFDHNHEGLTLTEKQSSEYTFIHVPGKDAFIRRPPTVGMYESNISAYLERLLCRLSGRLVECVIETGTLMDIRADSSEQIYRVSLDMHTTACILPGGIERSVCKLGQPDCCIFLMVSSHGFHCMKFDPSSARSALERKARGLRTGRIGNCGLLHRSRV